MRCQSKHTLAHGVQPKNHPKLCKHCRFEHRNTNSSIDGKNWTKHCKVEKGYIISSESLQCIGWWDITSLVKPIFDKSWWALHIFTIYKDTFKKPMDSILADEEASALATFSEFPAKETLRMVPTIKFYKLSPESKTLNSCCTAVHPMCCLPLVLSLMQQYVMSLQCSAWDSR